MAAACERESEVFRVHFYPLCHAVPFVSVLAPSHSIE